MNDLMLAAEIEADRIEAAHEAALERRLAAAPSTWYECECGERFPETAAGSRPDPDMRWGRAVECPAGHADEIIEISPDHDDLEKWGY